jgi:hypothetical protein
MTTPNELTQPPPATTKNRERVTRDLIGVLADFWPQTFQVYKTIANFSQPKKQQRKVAPLIANSSSGQRQHPNKLGGARKGCRPFSRRTAMLSKSPTATPNTTFAFSDGAMVRLAADFKCPHCGHGLHATDVDIDIDIDNVDVRLICGGCHKDILTIETAS